MLFIFDMGGVVTNTFKMDSIYQKLNISKNDFSEICKKNNNDIWHKLETGIISVNQFWNEYNGRIQSIEKAKPAETDLFRLFFHPSKNLQTIELIKSLKKNNRVVCGTNTIQSHWENHMERGDYAFFNQTYASNKIGCAKPDPHFFELILEAEETEAQNAFFTDDKEENVAAAASLGIHAELFTTAAELTEKWKLFY
ncbi:MAG: HAD hydrolase-like protein [Treponema sp.]|nr:HAD hydrolase-like protein [Spirochaetia bacterium]MDD7535193.1 HAD hydrolase-like protein [Treponema sp.]MDY5758691.1 HAD hydrolase-like protein [Treponema sp.]MDY5816899.1 HAD hydrolase-like protein [Treponema sp.]